MEFHRETVEEGVAESDEVFLIELEEQVALAAVLSRVVFAVDHKVLLLFETSLEVEDNVWKFWALSINGYSTMD